MSIKLSKEDFWISTFLPFSAAMAAAGTLIPLFIIFTGPGGIALPVSYIGFLSAISSCVSLPLAFIWGKLTDDSGKRKVFILTMFISGFGILFGYFFASNLIWLIILSVLSGLLFGAGDTAKNMYIFDKYPPELWEEKIAKYQQQSGIGACAGLVFGALFPLATQIDFQIFFLICAILCGISAVLGYLLIKDVSKDKLKNKVERIPIMNMDLPYYSSIYTPRKVISYEIKSKDEEEPKKSQFTMTLILFFLASFAMYLASTLTFTPLPAFIISPSLGGINASSVFWIFLGYYVVSVIGYTFAGNWIDKKGNRKILFIGLLIRIAVYALFAIFAVLVVTLVFTLTISFVIIVILLVFSGMSYALMNVALQNTLPRLIQRNVGEILAIYSIIVGISGILGSFFSGMIVEASGLGYPWLFLFSVIFAGIAMAIFFKAVQKKTP